MTWLYLCYYAILKCERGQTIFKVQVCYVQKPLVHLNLASCGAFGRGEEKPETFDIAICEVIYTESKMSEISLHKYRNMQGLAKVVDVNLLRGIILRRVPLRSHSLTSQRDLTQNDSTFLFTKSDDLNLGKYNLIGCWCASQRNFFRWVKSK